MLSDEKNYCHDAGDRPGCRVEADERYTMRFDDLGKPPVYWCSFCGPDAHATTELLVVALKTRGPEFFQKASDLIGKAEAEAARKRS